MANIGRPRQSDGLVIDVPEYWTWRRLRRRCYEPGHKSYSYYGGRGITVCDEWRKDFWAFYRHVGVKPSPLHSLDRIDNDGNYEPGNVRWATPRQQQRNRRGIRRITFGGKTMCMAEWAEKLGFKKYVLKQRLALMSVEKALDRNQPLPRKGA